MGENRRQKTNVKREPKTVRVFRWFEPISVQKREDSGRNKEEKRPYKMRRKSIDKKTTKNRKKNRRISQLQKR